ncbi:hypothetical protein JHL17_15085 [Azospirillum sp. YIM B02556]|uniref:Uncharacterized protein n=1 Tax=Azospirillum endophyticum TaxID=2800326 RepID=A0ABS1F636_9PROT|nr:hypothetical protein [Azospirillum endophyticum]MBK1838742.1 hypothetical protein [Azospirillum endophyticum]
MELNDLPWGDAVSYDFNRLLNANLSLNERPMVLMWAAVSGGAAEAVFLTCLEQFKQSPSKAKVKVIHEWLLDQDSTKGDGHWGPMNLEADGVSNTTKASATTIAAASTYYIGRKSWWGKKSSTLNAALGNNPAPNMFDVLVEPAATALGTVQPWFGSWSLSKVDRKDSIVVNRLKGMEYMNNAFMSAGFNTAAMGVRLPFKFR